jgi:PilZ domain
MNPTHKRRSEFRPRASSMGDRRSAQRFSARWPLRYRVSHGALKGEWKNGQSVDMSTRGILIQTPEHVSKGGVVEVEVDWPGVYHNKPMVWLILTGTVARADARGTALRILSHQFRYAGCLPGFGSKAAVA